jgi:16S rRNA (cytosine967-C5)-methyltransferase
VAEGLPAEQRPWTQELVYGTVRLQGRLDHLLDLHLKEGIGSLPPSLLPILRMGAYQLLYMVGTPDYAAVSQAVEESSDVAGGRMKGVVNGVLRSLAREGGGPERFPRLDDDPVGHLSRWGSVPEWLARRWLEAWGPREAAELIDAANRIPTTHLRPLDGDLQRARHLLAEGGIESTPGPRESGTLALAAGSSPGEALKLVPGVIQDPAAGWVVAWCGDVSGRQLVDLCAAPGGKAVALVGRGARVVAADRSLRRLRLLVETRDRLGLELPLVAALGEAPPFRPVEVVLVDAPCSGTGTLARHPDARWRLSEADIPALSRVQDGILDGAARIVAPGGLLIYATCTLEPEENGERIEAFLRRHREFIVEGGGGVPPEVRENGRLRVLPHRTGTDGAFAVRLRRRG